MSKTKCNIFQCDYKIKRMNVLIYQRHILVFMLMCAVMNLYGMRFAVNDAVAYLKRTNQTNNATATPAFKEMTAAMNWSSSQFLMMRRYFAIGYVIGHLPSGVLCDLHGGRPFLLAGIIISTLNTFATPSIMRYCPWWAMIIRNVFLGIAQGITIPAIYTLMSHWFPATVMTVNSSIGFSGGTLGNLLGQIFARRFIEELDSWTWVFYTWGIISTIWIVIACCYIFSYPDSHPFVSETERERQQEEMGVVLPDKIPFTHILTDSGVWALLVGQCGHDWTLFICITSLRKYIRETLNVDVSRNLVALYCRHLLYWANTCACGFLVNYIIRKELLPTHNVRAIFAAIGIITPCVPALILTYCSDNPNLIIALSILTLFLKGPVNAGLKANIFDITRHYAGTVSSLTNGLGALTSAVSVDLINNMAPYNTVQEWKKIVWMSFAVCCYSYLVFFIWIKSTTANWDFEKKTDRNLRFVDGHVVRSRRRSSFFIK